MPRSKRPRDGDDQGVRVEYLDVGGHRLAVMSLPMAGLAPALQQLTGAEREVAALLLAGHSQSRIAAIRGTSTRTVANQVASVYRKLGVSSRAELAAKVSSPTGN